MPTEARRASNVCCLQVIIQALTTSPFRISHEARLKNLIATVAEQGKTISTLTGRLHALEEAAASQAKQPQPPKHFVAFDTAVIHKLVMVLIAKTLLESSNFSDPSTGSVWQFQALELAEQILSTTPDHKVHMLAVIRRKALSRLVRGEIFDNEDAGLVQHSPSDALSTALLWDLQLSQAQDCIQRDDFSGARRAIEQAVSSPPAKLSTLGLLVYKRLRCHFARYLYLAGEFDQAKAILKQELATLQDGKKVKDTLTVLLVGVNCELGASSEALRLAKSAVQNQKGSMRVNILLAEAYLHAGIKCTYEPSPSMELDAETSFSEAKSICEKAMRSFESHPHFDQVAKVERIAYLRAVTVVARISALKAFHDNGNLDEARENWIKVLQAVSKCGWKKRGFMEGMCHYTMAALGDGEASKRDMAMASTLL